MNKYTTFILIAFLLLPLGTLAAISDSPNEPRTKNPEYSQMDAERQYRLPIDNVIEGLDITPGMSIVDIGAGRGYFTLPFARKLNGTGIVYATDVDRSIIDHINKNISKEGLRNISPVVVGKEGLDPFYKKHSFDIVFLSHVYEYIYDPVDYFEELRPSVKMDTGRIFIVQPKTVTSLGKFHFRDFREIIRILNSNGNDFPAFKYMDKDVQAYLGLKESGDVPQGIKDGLIAGFNKILSDPAFYKDMTDYYYVMTKDSRRLMQKVYSSDVELAKWLVVRLDSDSAFTKKEKALNEVQRTEVAVLNQIILSAIIKGGIIRRFNVGNVYVPYVEKGSIISKLEAAGYVFVKDHGTLPYHYFLEFKRKV